MKLTLVSSIDLPRERQQELAIELARDIENLAIDILNSQSHLNAQRKAMQRKSDALALLTKELNR